jgi:hypothetical protein
MAHPYHQHREHQVGHRRVGDVILKKEPAGSKEHAKSHAFSKVTSKSAAVSHDKVTGHSAPKRYARGGKVKKGGKGHQTNIAIVMPHKEVPPAAGPIPGGPPAGPGAAGPALPPAMAKPPMAGPPGMPPGGAPPPGMPMRKAGGRIKNIDGEATEANIGKWSGRAAKNSFMRGGAATGVGREEKAAKAKRK